MEFGVNRVPVAHAHAFRGRRTALPLRDICAVVLPRTSLSSQCRRATMSNPTATPQAAAPAVPPRHEAAAALACELDATALNRLRELDPTGENHVLQRVMVAFEGSLTRLMQQAEVAQSNNDIGAIRHVVHTLKSSSASIGALELSSCCAFIEQQLREQRTEHLAQQMSVWQSEAARVLALVKTARIE